jgi:succinate dehydrogenase flavin-adding protein (antitoxin of CptAB toxin-antitoxin module)
MHLIWQIKLLSKSKNRKHCDISKLFFQYKSRGILETDTKIESRDNDVKCAGKP